MKEDGAHLSFFRRRTRCVLKEARLLLLQRFGVNCNISGLRMRRGERKIRPGFLSGLDLVDFTTSFSFFYIIFLASTNSQVLGTS